MTQVETRVSALEWRDGQLWLLDQRALPHQHSWIGCQSAAETAAAIRDMVVRGAPAIGIAAAYGMALDALAGADLHQARQILAASRPTAVNLFWALERLTALPEDADGALWLDEARRIHAEDIEANRAMSAFGAGYLMPGTSVYTHCNTGSLATGGVGTALGVIRTAWADGKLANVYAGETRPWLQGARLTAWELMQDDIPVELVCDGAAAQLFRQQQVDWVIVGADRITANGDVANKIGTYSLAVLARYHGARVMVVAPTTTFDLDMSSGEDIPIEQRPASEVTSLQGVQIAPAGCRAINPSFDVTPAGLIDVIATEKGLIHRPDTHAVADLLQRQPD